MQRARGNWRSYQGWRLVMFRAAGCACPRQMWGDEPIATARRRDDITRQGRIAVIGVNAALVGAGPGTTRRHLSRLITPAHG